MRKKRSFLKSMITVFVCTLAVYAGCSVFYLMHFGPRTYIGDLDVSHQSKSDAASSMIVYSQQVPVTFYRANDTVFYSSLQNLGGYLSGMNCFPDTSYPGFLWPKCILQDTKYCFNDSVSFFAGQPYDAMVSSGVFDKLSGVDDIPSYLMRDEDGFGVVYGSSGGRLDKHKFADYVMTELMNGNFEIRLSESDAFLTQDEYNLELEHLADDGNRILSQQIYLHSGADGGFPEVSFQLPSFLIRAALKFDLDTLSYHIDFSVLTEYVSSLAKEYNVASTVSYFTTEDGTQIEIPGKTTLGRTLDQVSLVESLSAMILSGDGGTIDFLWKDFSAFDKDVDTYIEISLEKQHMWMFLDGELFVDTPVTTGASANGMETPSGFFNVVLLQPDFTMTGPGYEAHCDYFIRVTKGGVGIHDASWRSEYGDAGYTENGSHGCINTPYDAVKTMYDALDEMDDYHVPVIIY